MIFFFKKFDCLFNYYYMNKPVTLLIVFTCGLYDLNLPSGKTHSNMGSIEYTTDPKKTTNKLKCLCSYVLCCLIRPFNCI